MSDENSSSDQTNPISEKIHFIFSALFTRGSDSANVGCSHVRLHAARMGHERRNYGTSVRGISKSDADFGAFKTNRSVGPSGDALAHAGGTSASVMRTTLQ